MIISTLNKCFLVQEKETVPSSLCLSPSLCPKKANQSVLLSALRKLARARSALEGGKAGAGFRGRRGGDTRTWDVAYFSFVVFCGPKEAFTGCPV